MLIKTRNIFLFLAILLTSALSAPQALAQWGWPTCGPNEYFDWTLGCVPLTPPPPTGARKTTLFVGTPTSQAGGLKGYGVSTEDVDQILSTVSGMATDYTSQRADEVFVDLEALKTELFNDFRQAILDVDDIEAVTSFNIDANPLTLRVTQTDTSLFVTLLGVSANASVRSVRFCPFTCTRVTGTVGLDNIEIKSKFNLFTGQVSDTEISYDADISVSLSGLLGSIIELVIDEEALAERLLREATDDAAQRADLETFFSLREFLLSLRDYSDDIEAITDQFPTSVSVTPADISPLLGDIDTITVTSPIGDTDISDFLDDTIGDAVSIVDGFAGTGLQLDLTVKSGAEDNTDNMISFIVSHHAPELRSAQLTIDGIVEIRVDNIPAGTKSVRYFSGYDHIQFSPGNNYPTGFPSDGTIVAVGESNLISGLYSLPSNLVGVDFPDLADF